MEKLGRTFGGQIRQTNLIDKLIENLSENFCEKIVWNNWVEKLVANFGGKIDWKAM